MATQTSEAQDIRPKGYLTFKAIRADRRGPRHLRWRDARLRPDRQGFRRARGQRRTLARDPESRGDEWSGPTEDEPGPRAGHRRLHRRTGREGRALGVQLDRPVLDQRARLRGAVDRHRVGRRGPRRGSVQRRGGPASLPRLGGLPRSRKGEGRQAPRDQRRRAEAHPAGDDPGRRRRGAEPEAAEERLQQAEPAEAAHLHRAQPDRRHACSRS